MPTTPPPPTREGRDWLQRIDKACYRLSMYAPGTAGWCAAASQAREVARALKQGYPLPATS